MLTRRHLLAGAAALAAGVPFAKAQSNFASQPIHILVGYAAGGGVDIVARLLQEPMKAALGQPIIIENRTGASAMLATGAVAKAPPDGYTLLMAASGEVAINHFLFKEKMAYDPVKELAPIAMIGSVPCVVVVADTTPVRNPKELVAYAKANPGHYGASYDAGGVSHTSQELLLNITGRDVLTIGRKYRGAWHGQLRLKIIMISNKVPNFNDPVLVSRFIKVHFGQSFEKREDVDLRNKLKAEISGIAARCLTAYRRLIERGKFIQPQSGVELERKVLAESDPWIAFVNDTFVIDVAGMVNCAVAKLKFETWCDEHGRSDLLLSAPTASLLTQRLKSVEGLEALRTFRPHGGVRQYVGLRLKTSDETWQEIE